MTTLVIENKTTDGKVTGVLASSTGQTYASAYSPNDHLGGNTFYGDDADERNQRAGRWLQTHFGIEEADISFEDRA